MNEQKKRELIQIINKIREELGLNPYPPGHLEAKDFEELRELYSQYYQMREDYKRKEKERKLKLSFKVPLVGILILLTITLSIQFVYKPFNIGFLHPSPASKKEEKEVVSFILTFGYVVGNDVVLILHNKGNVNMTSFNVTVDGTKSDYEIISGSIPVEPLRSLYFLVRDLCDSKNHVIRVTSNNFKAEFNLTNECETGSRLQ